jgi:hypothetical protein
MGLSKARMDQSDSSSRPQRHLSHHLSQRDLPLVASVGPGLLDPRLSGRCGRRLGSM